MSRALLQALVATGLGALLAGALAAQAPIVTTVYNSGPTQSRYDMVILAEGYQVTEQTRFNQDVQTFLTALFQKQPYATFANYYNVHTVFRASVDSGADQPDVTPPIYKNTVYDATYNTGGTARCLYIQNTSLALADAALAPANEGRVLVFVNDSRYGGCASTFAVSYNGSSMSEVQIHEIGHSLGALADEYDYPYQTYTGGEPSQANITTSSVGQKWSHWWGTDGISAFQGAGYYLYGLWRPKSNCLMRALGVTLCAVCKEQISKLLNSVVDTIDTYSPATTQVMVNVGATQLFSISHIVPAGNAPTVEWKLDGAVVPGATGASWLFDATGLALGNHTVAASVTDHTAMVRSDPANTLTETQTWNVTVVDPTVAQLHFGSLSGNLVWVQPGSAVTFTATVQNDGPAAAGPFDVEIFLTTTQPYSLQDVYLGRYPVAGLAAAGSTTVTMPVQLPWRLDVRPYYVYAVIDRTNAVHETNEGDNYRMSVVIVQSAPCTTHLEYVDPLLYPTDAATLSLGAGGTVHPTVVARCAAPGTLYLVVWGTSGTVPGTVLAPGVTVPINQDFFTQLGLSAVNGPWFPGFFGVLDAQGFGRATFALPPASGLLPLQGNFAAVLVDPALGFSAATNPIAITLQ